jgi:hypothetical protein
MTTRLRGDVDRGIRREKMRTKLWFSIVAVALFAAFTTVPVAWAQKTVNEKGRVVYHFVKVEVMQVGDVPGHIVGIVDASGLIFLDTGEVPNYSGKITFDLINGTGPHQTYVVTTFEDKSTQVTLNKGLTTARRDGTSTFEGTFAYVGGTGRFAGIKGGGSYAGKRTAPVTPGGPADAFSDYVGTYTLPSQ